MSPHPHHHRIAPSGLQVAFFVNLSFTLIEIAGSFLTNSIAIFSDAVHDLGDTLALGLAWWFGAVAQQRKANDLHTYGYHRLSLLAALINAVVLTAGSTFVLTQAIPRLITPEPSHAKGMIALAILGVVANGWAAYRTSKGASLNEKVVSWHLFEDVLGWATVLCGAVILHFTSWWWIDPLLAIAIALFILGKIITKLWEIGRLFLQLTPPDVDLPALRRRLNTTEGVTDIHHLHAWSLDGQRHVLTFHATVAEDSDPSEVKARLRDAVPNGAFEHVTIELERQPSECSNPDSRDN